MKMPGFLMRNVTASAMLLAAGAASADTIKIGINQPLTGPFAASGNYVANGAKIAAEQINAAGGVLGKQIQLVIEDNKSNPTEAAAVAEKLITHDRVPVLMGAWGSGLTLAVLPKLMQYKVPMLVETSSNSKITQLGNPYVFRISPPSWIEAEKFKEFLPKLEMKKVDFLAINNDWGLGTITDYSKMFADKNIQVGLRETMDQTAQDMSAQLSKLKASDSDTIIVTTGVEQMTLILRQAMALGIKKKIVTTSGSQNPDQLIQQAGTAANNSIHMVLFAPWDVSKTAHPEKSKAFLDAWAKAGHDIAGVTESYRGYDGVYVIAAAIQKAGTLEPEAIVKALWQLDVPTLNGNVVFQKDGPKGRESGQYHTNATLVIIKDGKILPYAD